MRDTELVNAALAGDARAFAGLVERHVARTESVVRRLVGTDVEDVVQEALLRAYLGLSRLREPERFGAWLCGIAVNVAKMRLQRRTLESQALSENGTNGVIGDAELLGLVREALGVLPRGQRDAVLLHYIDGLSCEEIAAVLESSPGAIRVRLHRARAQLRAHLAAFGPTSPTEGNEMIEMKLQDVLVRVDEHDASKLVADARVALLQEADGDRVLTIWIGPPEGNSLALRLTGETTPRPRRPSTQRSPSPLPTGRSSSTHARAMRSTSPSASALRYSPRTRC
jgi:RNA polymerase sigma factor (sigma-70 family)